MTDCVQDLAANAYAAKLKDLINKCAVAFVHDIHIDTKKWKKNF
jgi:hypothetical protein